MNDFQTAFPQDRGTVFQFLIRGGSRLGHGVTPPDGPIFRTRQRMIRQQPNGGDMLQTGEKLRRAGIPAVIPAPSVADGLESATAWAQDNQGTALICGSLFLVGEVLALREGLGAIDPSEALRAP